MKKFTFAFSTVAAICFFISCKSSEVDSSSEKSQAPVMNSTPQPVMKCDDKNYYYSFTVNNVGTDSKMKPVYNGVLTKRGSSSPTAFTCEVGSESSFDREGDEGGLLWGCTEVLPAGTATDKKRVLVKGGRSWTKAWYNASAATDAKTISEMDNCKRI